jgi:hypothetical protein
MDRDGHCSGSGSFNGIILDSRANLTELVLFALGVGSKVLSLWHCKVLLGWDRVDNFQFLVII